MTVNDANKKELPVIVRIPKNIIQLVIFLLIQLLLLPVAIAVLPALEVRQYLYSRKLGTSITALKILGYRWLFHYFRTREDEATVKITKALPTASHYGMLGVYGAAIIANRICGFSKRLVKPSEPGKESFLTFAPSRTVFFDRVMEKHLPSMYQVVLLGAGFDSRPFKFCQGKQVKVFELDEARTQQLKIEALEKAGLLLPEHDWITFVPVDFEQEAWVEKLVESGFDTSKKTFFLWEGVTPYLTGEAIKQALKTVATSSGKGSVITFDYISKKIQSGKMAKAVKMHGDASIGFLFGIDHEKNPRETVETLLKEAGLSVGEIYLMGEGGKFGGLVEAVKL